MKTLHDDLAAVSEHLRGVPVIARGERYIFKKWNLEVERDRPVADGYILHLHIDATVWRWEKTTAIDGKKIMVRRQSCFKPEELDFGLQRSEEQER